LREIHARGARSLNKLRDTTSPLRDTTSPLRDSESDTDGSLNSV
jgi:hypothetical protein